MFEQRPRKVANEQFKYSKTKVITIKENTQPPLFPTHNQLHKSMSITIIEPKFHVNHSKSIRGKMGKKRSIANKIQLDNSNFIHGILYLL